MLRKFDAQVKSIKLRRKPSSEIPRRFGLTILDLARKNEKIVGITPANASGTIG
jgi:deoxyxylulose-5-phosphate synthase